MPVIKIVKPIFIILLFAFLFTSCKKEKSSIQYSQISSVTESDLYSVLKISADTLVTCGGKNSKGIILLSTNKGNTWNILNDSFDQIIYDVYFINSQLGFAGGGNADVFKTTDSGKSWEKLYLPFPLTGFPPNYRTPLRKIFFVNDSLGFICGGARFEAGIIFKTTDQGVNWTLTTFNNELRGILFINNNTGIACGYGIMLKTVNCGTSWEIINSPNEFYTSIKKIKNEIWSSGYNGGIYKSAIDNMDWLNSNSGNNAFSSRTHFNCLEISENETFISAGNNGDYAISTDHGNTWNEGQSFNNSTIKCILLFDNHSGIAVGNEGTIFKFSF
jgi:photosystem II stability/assembly factor-like uncharacterized protein